MLGECIAEGRHGRVKAVVSSDLSRAADTARIIAEKLGIPVDEVKLASELRERHMGRLQGMTRKEAAEKDPMAWNAFMNSRNNDAFKVPGGGESYEDMWDRAVGYMERMAASVASESSKAIDVDEGGDDGRIVVVTHGGRARQPTNHQRPTTHILN